MMNIVLWILQISFGLFFVYHGYIMLKPPANLQPMMAYINALPTTLRSFIGVVEILGGLGLILPWLAGIWPTLTPIAATGLAIIMGLAALYHVMRKEYANVVFNLALLLGLAFIAYGRFVLVPF